jgi:hypothetical protein
VGATTQCTFKVVDRNFKVALRRFHVQFAASGGASKWGEGRTMGGFRMIAAGFVINIAKLLLKGADVVVRPAKACIGAELTTPVCAE